MTVSESVLNEAQNGLRLGISYAGSPTISNQLMGKHREWNLPTLISFQGYEEVYDKVIINKFRQEINQSTLQSPLMWQIKGKFTDAETAPGTEKCGIIIIIIIIIILSEISQGTRQELPLSHTHTHFIYILEWWSNKLRKNILHQGWQNFRGRKSEITSRAHGNFEEQNQVLGVFHNY